MIGRKGAEEVKSLLRFLDIKSELKAKAWRGSARLACPGNFSSGVHSYSHVIVIGTDSCIHLLQGLFIDKGEIKREIVQRREAKDTRPIS